MSRLALAFGLVAVTSSGGDVTLNCPGFQPWGYSGTATPTLLNGEFKGGRIYFEPIR